ncbi:MAG: hypothetical protein WCG05_05595, partial [Alphaproteobacteria bacterium]
KKSRNLENPSDLTYATRSRAIVTNEGQYFEINLEIGKFIEGTSYPEPLSRARFEKSSLFDNDQKICHILYSRRKIFLVESTLGSADLSYMDLQREEKESYLWKILKNGPTFQVAHIFGSQVFGSQNTFEMLNSAGERLRHFAIPGFSHRDSSITITNDYVTYTKADTSSLVTINIESEKQKEYPDLTGTLCGSAGKWSLFSSIFSDTQNEIKIIDLESGNITSIGLFETEWGFLRNFETYEDTNIFWTNCNAARGECSLFHFNFSTQKLEMTPTNIRVDHFAVSGDGKVVAYDPKKNFMEVLFNLESRVLRLPAVII